MLVEENLYFFSRTRRRAARHYIKERTNTRKLPEQGETHPKAHTAQRKKHKRKRKEILPRECSERLEAIFGSYK